MTSPTNPFSHWTILDPNITDPNNGGIDTLSITFSGGGTLTDGANFAGTRTLSGSNGSYTLTGTPADINAELNALSFNGAPNTSFTLSDRFIVALAVSFNRADGAAPQAGLISDAAGNLLGTTAGGGDGASIGNGTVFELANIGTVSAPIHSGTPTTLWSFTGGADGGLPLADLMRDAAGDLFGTTETGGANGLGTVFEIANTGTVSAPVYSSTPTTLWSFNGTNGARPQAGLISDAAGDLFGTTSAGGLPAGLINTRGTVFEIANTGSVDAPVYGTLTTLVRFGPSSGGGAPGSDPHADLIIDAAGDLFGTTASTAFELVNTGTVSAPVYSSTPTTLFTDGAEPAGSLVRDAAGDLFGTTEFGGSGAGTVYEIANGTRTTLWAFSGGAHSINDGANPQAGLISDAAGDLFGTTSRGGTNDLGTVFELVNTGTVSAPNYTNTFSTLWSFTGGADGRVPDAGLTIDAAGDLFGTASQGGTSGQGAVFELVKTDSGYTMAPSFTGTLAGQTTVSEAPVKPFSGVTITDLNKFGGSAADTLSIMFSGGGTLTDGAGFAGTSTLSGSNGHYTLTGTAADITTELDALSFAPVNGVPNTQVTTHFTLFDQGGATDNVLASFNRDNGAFPLGSLIIDAAGDLLGTTSQGGPGGSGTVFEIANTGTVSAPIYSSTPTTLVSFDGTDGGFPVAGLIRDAAGDLFGTTETGGTDGAGTVFEIANSGTVSAPVYSSTPTTPVSFNGTDGGNPAAGLIVDAAGNLFGTTETGGTDGAGTVFEIANSGSVGAPVYSNTPTTLWFFTGGADGSHPTASLISDAAGDLFGTTDSTVFELANTGTVSAPAYGSAPTTLASFGGSGLISGSGLIINAAGDLFGTTLSGGAHGAVFELVNTGTVSAPSYGDTPVTLVSFTGGDDGDLPFGGVVSDAAGDLFGTTYNGGGGGGTVFEVVNTGTVSAPIYSGTPRTLWAFTAGADGANPQAGLTIDVAGDLFGTTLNGGSGGAGTAFELVKTGSVYTFLSAIDTTTSVIDSDPAVAPTITGTVAGQTTVSEAAVAPFSGVTVTDANNGGTDTDTLSITLSGGGTLTDGADFAGTSSLSGSNGSYTLTGTAADITAELDALSFTPVNGVPNTSVTTTFTLSDTSSANFLASFNGTDGACPLAGLIRDGAGNLFGTTYEGGTNNDGTVFEIANSGTVSAPIYSSTPTTLVSFNSLTDGFAPQAGLIIDANGDLLGTTEQGGTGDDGTVFEIANTGTPSAPIYSSTPTTLWSFTGDTDGALPRAGLISDSRGNLFGTTEQGGTTGLGTVFEFVNDGDIGSPLYNTLTTLASFNGADGANPTASLISDAAGDLFGTTFSGGTDGDGTVFELANSGTVSAPIYSSTPTTLRSFTGGADGFRPAAGLIIDAAGNLLGTTSDGNMAGFGTVFEIVNTGTVSAPIFSSLHTTVVSFNGTDGSTPEASLIRDAAGDLFGTTFFGGTYGAGTVFEISNTGTVSAPVYSSTPTTLWSFTGGADGGYPQASLTIDAAGDLFGTTYLGGAGGKGTVFELVKTGSGYTFAAAVDATTSVIDHDPAVAPVITGAVAGQAISDTQTDDPFSGVTIGDSNVGVTETLTVTLDSATKGALSNLGGGSYNSATGVYLVSGTAAAVTAALDGLVFTPTANHVAPGLTEPTTFTIAVNDGAASTVTDATTTVITTSVNDAPTATNLTQSLSLAEDAAALKLFTLAPVVSDVDSPDVTATLTLSSTAAGVLIGADSSVGGVYTITGSQAHVNAALAAMTFDSAQDFNGTANVAVLIDDGHNGPQGSNPTGTVSIDVSAVNDAPVNTVPAGPLTTPGDTNFVISGLSVSDVDATALTTTLHVDHGTLTVAAGSAAVSGDGTGTLTLSGTAAEINATLAAANHVVYHGLVGFAGADSLTVTTDDGGGTGAGGPQSAVDVVLITDQPFAQHAAHDFNGDGTGDIVWRNDAGVTAIWDMNDTTILHGNSQGIVPANWTLAGTGDFNGDGMSDLLWRNDAGGLATWDMNDGNILSANSLGSVPANWHIAGTGDFNGDHMSDILWRNDAGGLATWDMNDGAIVQANSLGSVPDNWKIAGTGDFNGDGKSDILWRSDAGAVAIWDMNDGAIVHANSVGILPANWHIAGTGDFNGDHKSDILLNNDAGVVAIWDMNDGAIVGGGAVATVPANWHIAGTGDYNGDGKTDILWHNDAGVAAIWDMNDTAIVGGGSLGVVPTNWHIIV